MNRNWRVSEEFDRLSHAVIGRALEVHRTLGPGLLESVYEECLAHELSLAGLRFERQKRLPVRYKGVHLASGCRVDLVVEGALIVEVKNVSRLLEVHESQLLTYMRLAEVRTGLLLNFNVRQLKRGIRRLAV